ncbi:MAG: hypothetical protein GX267_02580 [Fibrobacter sp.]|jgi:hypothetical protein|nr:hypothetical protein [Fibrobacter sp.]
MRYSLRFDAKESLISPLLINPDCPLDRDLTSYCLMDNPGSWQLSALIIAWIKMDGVSRYDGHECC